MADVQAYIEVLRPDTEDLDDSVRVILTKTGGFNREELEDGAARDDGKLFERYSASDKQLAVYRAKALNGSFVQQHGLSSNDFQIRVAAADGTLLESWPKESVVDQGHQRQRGEP